MEHFVIKIAEHHFKINDSSLLENKFSKNFHILSDDINIKTDMSITLLMGYGISFKNYDVSITRQEDKILFSRADYLIVVDENYEHCNLFVHDDLALKHALINLYSSFIVFHNWGLLIHSSCVVENNKAHIFAGQSGAGKSTAARLSLPRELLSDEATIIKVERDSVTVFNSPFRSDTVTNQNTPNYPLNSIQLLVQSLTNNRIQISKSDAILELIGKIFYWKHDLEDARKILHLLKILIDNVPVYKLHFQKNNTFWELIS
jgi:hypothetical protein